MNYQLIINIYSLSQTCKDKELLNLLNEIRAILHVLLTRVAYREHKLEFEKSNTFWQDYSKYGGFSDKELNRKAELIYRIINLKITERF
jgi:hypothetical protein